MKDLSKHIILHSLDLNLDLDILQVGLEFFLIFPDYSHCLNETFIHYP